MSKLEHRFDPRLSTLRSYLEAMDPRMHLEAELGDGTRVPLYGLGETGT